MEDNALVSVIIPTKNSESTLNSCLESIKYQTYVHLKIIVVDNYSQNDDKNIATIFGANTILSAAKRSEARNIGAENSDGKLLLFIDSDMELEPDVIEKCVLRINEGFDAIIVPEISTGEGFWAKCKALEKTCYFGDETIEAARFFRRDVFERVGGYDCELEAGEDWDLNQRVKRMGFKTGRINSVLIHHEGKLDLWSALKKKYEYGKSISRYARKNPKEAKRQLSPVRMSFIRNNSCLLKDPVHALGMFILKIFEFAAGALGYLCCKRH